MQPGDIRLFGSSVHFSGAVQIYSDEFGWQGICPDSDWTDSDADAICQQLGFVGGDVATPVRSSAGPGGEPLSRRLYTISCPADFNSDSYTIGMCSARIGASDTSNCARGEGLYAAVNCSKFSSKKFLMQTNRYRLWSPKGIVSQCSMNSLITMLIVQCT